MNLLFDGRVYKYSKKDNANLGLPNSEKHDLLLFGLPKVAAPLKKTYRTLKPTFLI